MKGLQLWSKVQHTLFCREISYVASYASGEGGGSQNVTKDDEGWGGSGYPPKMMTSFMNSPLCLYVMVATLAPNQVDLI